MAKLGSLRTRGWRLGLDRMQEFVRLAGLQHKIGEANGPQFIHVAGTNGKGSTTAFIQSILVEQGHSTGAMFSPYVYDVCERVQIDRELIARDDFARLATRLLEMGRQLEATDLGGPTEFEIKTMLGFAHWAELGVDWVGIEVGLGGRLDATNVVTPRTSVIVNISLDHTEILGETVEEIAVEKAGIIKPGIPVILGNMPEPARDAICKIADARSAKTWSLGKEIILDESGIATPIRRHPPIHPRLRGSIQLQNAALAIAACDAAGAIDDPSRVADGVRKAWLPGRFEQVEYGGRRFILDGAHNPDAAKALLQTLKEESIELPVPFITGRVDGHDCRSFYEVLQGSISSAFVARLEFHRSKDPRSIIQEAREFLPTSSTHESVASALESCLGATHPGTTIVVTGSMFVVGEIGKLIRR